MASTSGSKRKVTVKKLESYLQDVDVFEEPKILLEQYPTTPHIAARVLHTVEMNYGDIEDKLVGDLGCGCGVLSIGASILGATHVTGVDIDQDALDVCQQNIDDLDIDNIDLVKADVAEFISKVKGQDDSESDEASPEQSDKNLNNSALKEKMFDTIIMNPPFGTKSSGIDMLFVQAGLYLARDAVYSLHKTSTRGHIEKKAKQWGVDIEVLAELNFDLKKTMHCHKKDTVDINVDLIRFSHKHDKQH